MGVFRARECRNGYGLYGQQGRELIISFSPDVNLSARVMCRNGEKTQNLMACRAVDLKKFSARPKSSQPLAAGPSYSAYSGYLGGRGGLVDAHPLLGKVAVLKPPVGWGSNILVSKLNKCWAQINVQGLVNLN